MTIEAFTIIYVHRFVTSERNARTRTVRHPVLMRLRHACVLI
jgi:hypothetical protein